MTTLGEPDTLLRSHAQHFLRRCSPIQHVTKRLSLWLSQPRELSLTVFLGATAKESDSIPHLVHTVTGLFVSYPRNRHNRPKLIP